MSLAQGDACRIDLPAKSRPSEPGHGDEAAQAGSGGIRLAQVLGESVDAEFAGSSGKGLIATGGSGRPAGVQGRALNAGVLAISHDTILLNRWADRTLHLTATGRLQPEHRKTT
ncbi:MAG: hypothetical protein LC775_11785 [Acidobacteria bacterium]|nr:hypothetical protein [Acidobacteriota bacterium]